MPGIKRWVSSCCTNHRRELKNFDSSERVVAFAFTMTLVDPNGKQWLHHLRVERSGTETPPSEVARYFLTYLTLDDIDETGKAPDVPFEAFAEDSFVDVYWDRDFTFDQVKEMCEVTLPDQLVGLTAEDEPEAIGPVWYDGMEIHWLPQDEAVDE